MGLPVFFPVPKITLRLPEGRSTSLPALCEEAGVACRVSGLSASRPLATATTPRMRVARMPGALSAVWLGIPPGSPRRRALLALGMLAYAVFDYGARETLRGLPESRAAAGPGRPRSARALTPAERQRRRRARSA
jgi:hypothetical protein